jgi:hypothetical protein
MNYIAPTSLSDRVGAVCICLALQELVPQLVNVASAVVATQLGDGHDRIISSPPRIHILRQQMPAEKDLRRKKCPTTNFFLSTMCVRMLPGHDEGSTVSRPEEKTLPAL